MRQRRGEEAIIDALLAQSEMAATPLLATPFDEGKFWHPRCSEWEGGPKVDKILSNSCIRYSRKMMYHVSLNSYGISRVVRKCIGCERSLGESKDGQSYRGKKVCKSCRQGQAEKLSRARQKS